MKKRLSGILTLLLVLVVQVGFAQELVTVSGTVTDDTGLPLPGVNVLVEGTNRGEQTDFDGNYAIEVAAGEVLVFSYLGMETVRMTFEDNPNLDVVLAPDAAQLEEVIVTAYGIERNEKSLSYSTTTVNASELTQAAPVNAVTALQGKSSGLNIITRNNGVNPSTAVIMRGYNSITSSNAALIVIDGIIQAETALNDLNPQDIHTTTMLKGASATALYGSQGANGAIIIETKKGSREQGMQVGISSSVTFEEIRYFPQMQSKFGSGTNIDEYNPVENTQWGPRYDGVVRRVGPILSDGTFQELPYAPIADNRLDFFQTGTTFINGVNISGGDEKSTFYFSARKADVSGVTPKDTYVKDNFRLNASRTEGKFRISSNISFFRDHENVAGAGGYQSRGVYWSVINTPSNIPLTSYKNWRTDPYSTPEGYFNEYYQNPYMIIDIARDDARSTRLQGNINLDYEFTDWLSANYTLAATHFKEELKNTREAVTYNPVTAPSRTGSNTPASVFEGIETNERLNSNLTINIDKDFGEDFNVNLILGNSLDTYRGTAVNVSGTQLVVPDLYDVSVRTGELQGGNSRAMSRKTGYFSDLTLGYKGFAYLNGAYRYDISSTLPLDNNGYSFYTFGGSLVATDAFPSLKGDVLDYFKLRASYASVGNDPTIGYINEAFSSASGFPFGSIPGFSVPIVGTNANFQPEISKTFEAGVELAFLSNRITLNGTYFQTNTTNQFLSQGTSYASGIISFRTNAGEMQNAGYEIDLGLTPIRSEDFRWDINVNYTKINNEVLDLGESDRIQVGLASSVVGSYAQEGLSYPQIYGTAYTRDEQGRVVINPETGDPLVSSELVNLGSATPDLIIGGSTTFGYKNFSLTAVADYQTGHSYYNSMVNALEFTGSTMHSATANRRPFVFPNSSYQNAQGQYVDNTNILTSDGGFSFWNNTYNAIAENYVVDATTLKLREVALNYRLPGTLLEGTFFSSVNIGLVGRNLVMLRSAQNVYTDPEFTTDSQQITGIGTIAQLPPTANYGLKVDITF